MNTEDKLIRARIKLQEKNPFFAYLSLFLKFKKEDKDNPLPQKSMGVNSKGQITYNEEWVDNLNEEELMGVLAHEILHLSLLHLLRKGTRDMNNWNIACDICVNGILEQNSFVLPKGLKVDMYDTFEYGKIKIEDCSKKTAEMIYEELPSPKKDKNGNTDELSDEGFDEHQHGEGISQEEQINQENEWLKRTEEAYCSAKSKGDVPKGIERYIDELKRSKVNWKALLLRTLNSSIPNDYTWAKPHKKSIICDTYLPNILREKAEVVIAIDTSGSIGRDELTDFISEIVGMARAYNNNIDMKIITHDCEVYDCVDVKNGNIEKIKQISIKGGGGTAHQPVFDYVKEKLKGTRMLICLTDGESDIDEINFKEYPFQKVFVLTEHGEDEQIVNTNSVLIRLGDK
jgi:predicted metal-dependent peptidase